MCIGDAFIMDVSLNKRLKDDYRECGRTFVDMIKEHDVYGVWIDAVTEYEVKLVSDRHSLSRQYFIVKKSTSPVAGRRLPRITLEVITTDDSESMPATRNLEDSSSYSDEDGSVVNFFEGSLLALCQQADEVVSEMKALGIKGDDFCIKLLEKVWPESASKESTFPFGHSKLGYKRKNQPLDPSQYPKKVSKISDVKMVVPKSCSEVKLSIDDHPAIVKILDPVKDKWKEIGQKLVLHSYTLNQVQVAQEMHDTRNSNCLDKMLRRYIEVSTPSFHELVSVIADFDDNIAQQINEYAETKLPKETEL